ncbi:MAG: hypothetical protein H0V47_09900 [Chloroflexia bacterium]|nr:hypothetical protein [Chloroflexia bacterium]
MPHDSGPDQLFIWLDSNPEGELANVTIDDTPGVSDLDLIAEAVLDGRLGRYLPVTIRFATHPEPIPRNVRSIDTARLLRDRTIPHLRRYEIVSTAADDALL